MRHGKKEDKKPDKEDHSAPIIFKGISFVILMVLYVYLFIEKMNKAKK